MRNEAELFSTWAHDPCKKCIVNIPNNPFADLGFKPYFLK